MQTDTPRVIRPRRKSPLVRLAQSWQLYVLLLPAVAYLIIFHYIPLYGVQIAFRDYRPRNGFLGSTWVGLKHFKYFLHSPQFPQLMRNTVLLSLYSLIFTFPLPILLALLLNECGSVGYKKFVQNVTYAPHFISTVVLCGMITLFLSQSNGIINKLVVALGGQAYAYMQDAKAFKWVYVLSGIWQSVGWSSIIYFAALSGLDKSQQEAADIDGANRFQKIVHINFPCLIPTITILLILNCGSLLTVGYEKAFLLQTSPNLAGSEIISTYVYKMGLEKSDFSFSTAVGLLNSVCNAIILLIANGVSRAVSQNSLF